MITNLEPGKILFDYGPMQIVLSAFADTRPMEEELTAAANYGAHLLGQISDHLAEAKKSGGQSSSRGLPPLLQKMKKAAAVVEDETLTPMAAVAGTVADELTEFLVKKGATQAVVNNGGDIAFQIAKTDKISVGLCSSLFQDTHTHLIQFYGGDGYGGVATSGLGGRGFTCGIASAVTVLAKSAAVADACATFLANCTYTPDAGIIRRCAAEIDPQTDIPDALVTVGLKNIRPEVFQQGINNSLLISRKLLQEEIIKGVVIFAGPYMSVLPPALASRVKERKVS